MGFNGIYPLVNVYITMERSTIFYGKIHYFDWAIFQFAMFVYQVGYLAWIRLGSADFGHL